MGKIDFGYNNYQELYGGFEGIELYNGDFIDMISIDNRDYLITKIVESVQGLNGKIDVREVFQDFYADGSYVSYANQKKSVVCESLENLLNQPMVKDKIKNEKSVYNVLRDMNLSVSRSKLKSIDYPGTYLSGNLVSIKPDLFEKVRSSIKDCSNSIYGLQQQIIKLEQQIELMNMNEFSNSNNNRHI